MLTRPCLFWKDYAALSACPALVLFVASRPLPWLNRCPVRELRGVLEAAHRDGCVLALRPLSAADRAHFLKHCLGAGEHTLVPPALQQYVSDVAAGNPWHIETLARALLAKDSGLQPGPSGAAAARAVVTMEQHPPCGGRAAEEVLVLRAAAGGVGSLTAAGLVTPHAITGSQMELFDSLSPGLQEILKVASFLPESFPPAALRAALECDQDSFLGGLQVTLTIL